MTTNTGGSAFPYEDHGEKGMTLRDYFAAKAMQAILSSANCPKKLDEYKLAEYSYKLADDMLKAREA